MNLKKLIRILASLKLAVIIILGLAIVTAYGTIVESQYNAETAQKLVFHSWYMYALLVALCTSLIAVMVDRWPWQHRHTGFVLAHIGIIILIFGSVLTRYFGVDGSIIFEIGQSNKFVVVNDPEINVYTSFGEGRYVNVYSQPHDFLINPLPKEGLRIPLSQRTLEIVEFLPYALREEKIVPSELPGDGPAIYFQLQNPNVTVTDWLHQESVSRESMKDLGPAKVVITQGEYNASGQNAIVLKPRPDNETLDYMIYTNRSAAGSAKPIKTGIVKPGDTLETGWMGLVLRVLKYHPHARKDVLFHKREQPTEMTSSAIRVKFNGQDKWIGIDSVLKFFTEDAVFIVSYGNRRIDLGKVFKDPEFTLTLKKFEVGRYQGTLRAASYQSVLDVPGRGNVLVSMNEPLYYNGFTFYQASFQEDPQTGKPIASILSVNRDQGRWVKYFGSLLIVLGTAHLFWFKRRAAKATA